MSTDARFVLVDAVRSPQRRPGAVDDHRAQRIDMGHVTIQLSAPAQWHALARAAHASWPSLVILDLVSELADVDDSVLVSAHASDAAPPPSTTLPPRPGAAHALIVGAAPMTSESFTVWAQR